MASFFSLVIISTLCFISFIDGISAVDSVRKLDLPTTAVGPEAVTFDAGGRGAYTGISDGRVVRYESATSSFVEAFITAPTRNNLQCDGTNNPVLGFNCGRPVGLGFYLRTNECYIADAYRGFLVVSSGQRLATPLATGVEGVPFRFPNAVDVDQTTGDAYFTDASARFSLSEIPLAILANDRTGRLLKYNRNTRQVTVLLRNLGGPAGVALSADRSFIVVSNFLSKTITKLWLTGPTAGKSEVILTFQGRPDNIKRDSRGRFWVAVTESPVLGLLVNLPRAVLFDGNGNVLRTLELDSIFPEYRGVSVSEFQQIGESSTYYIGSREAGFLGQATLTL